MPTFSFIWDHAAEHIVLFFLLSKCLACICPNSYTTKLFTFYLGLSREVWLVLVSIPSRKRDIQFLLLAGKTDWFNDEYVMNNSVLPYVLNF